MKKSTDFAAREEPEIWELRLYIAGRTPKSVAAFANLKKMCEEHLPGRYKIEVIDLMQQPQLAAGDQIVAIPTLVRKLPEPLRRIVGDLSNTERTLVGLQLRPARSASEGRRYGPSRSWKRTGGSVSGWEPTPILPNKSRLRSSFARRSGWRASVYWQVALPMTSITC